MPVTTMNAADLRIDIDRLSRRLAELAAIGAIEGTEGCARLALTEEDRLGRRACIAFGDREIQAFGRGCLDLEQTHEVPVRRIEASSCPVASYDDDLLVA